MLYEVREYESVPGRLPALVARFRQHTLGLFKKHGLDVVFIAMTEFGENSNNQLVYVLRFASYQELQERWAAFIADPQWVEARRESEKDGPLVARVHRRLLNSVAFDAQ